MRYGNRRLNPGRVERPDGSVAYFTARWKLLLIACGSQLLAAVCVWVALADGTNHPVAWVRWPAVALAAFFIVYSLVFVFRSFVPTPVLLITADRVFISTGPGLGSTSVPRKWIDHVAVCPRWRGAPVLAFVLREDCPPVLEGRYRSTPWRAMPFGLPPSVTVTADLLPTPLSEVGEDVAAICGCPFVDLRIK